MRAFSRSWLEKASQTAAGRSKDGGVGQYGNYARKFTDVSKAEDRKLICTLEADVDANDIFGENVKKLEELKHKYDPENLFKRSTRLKPRPLVVVN